MIDETNQTNNTVGGDQAGGDIIHVNLPAAPSGCKEMTRLIEKYRQERKADATFNKYIDKIQHLSTPKLDEVVSGLEPKLSQAGRAWVLDFATKCKEVFTKTLAKNQFSETAQEICAYLLAEVLSRFHNNVLPKIAANRSQDEIGAIVQKEVIEAVQGLLEDNVLGLDSQEINGMLYFLTGNCHIKWVA